MFLSCGESRFKQWVTLFDSPDDDEYDGDFQEQDEEMPRVHFAVSVEPESTILQASPPPQKQSMSNSKRSPS